MATLKDQRLIRPHAPRITAILPDAEDPVVRQRTEDFTKSFAKLLVDNWVKERGLDIER